MAKQLDEPTANNGVEQRRVPPDTVLAQRHPGCSRRLAVGGALKQVAEAEPQLSKKVAVQWPRPAQHSIKHSILLFLQVRMHWQQRSSFSALLAAWVKSEVAMRVMLPGVCLLMTDATAWAMACTSGLLPTQPMLTGTMESRLAARAAVMCCRNGS